MADLISIQNGQAIPRTDLPVLDFDRFRERLLDISRTGYVVQFFAFQDGDKLMALAVMRQGDQLLAGCAPLPERYPSLTPLRAKFHLFEREIAEQYGIIPEGHPWLKMVRYTPNCRQRPDVFGNDYKEDIPGRYKYFTVEGEDIHEVAVGPVHAGIIEPGHFRFQCIGERVLHLEISHGYQHRGVESLLCQVPAVRRPIIAEGIAGDTAIANSLSYAHAVEALAGIDVDRSTQTVRTIALELERLANHVGDLGALAGDVAFTPPAAFFGRMRGEFLNLLLLLSGNRFGKGLIRPGGVSFDADATTFSAIDAKLMELRPEIEHCADLLISAHTVQARFENCGIVSREAAECLGLVGPAGRASWLTYDARITFPTERYADLPSYKLGRTSGDVLARTNIRISEIMHSFDLIKQLVSEAAAVRANVRPDATLGADSFVVTVNEAWRGELSHCVLTGEDDRIIRYKVKDPSFHNWSGLAMALRDEEISDFPVNNKSFNLSYCGMDL